MRIPQKDSMKQFINKEVLNQLITGTIIEYNSSSKTCKVKCDKAIFGNVADIQVNRSISSALLVADKKVLIGIIDNNNPSTWVLICVYS